MQPWVNGVWLGRETLSDARLTGTAAGVMRSRAVRRLQEPARWLPEALKAMFFTLWSPHLNLPGRPRLQSLAYEEPIEARALPTFIETPSTTTTQKEKPCDLRANQCRVMPSSQQMQRPDPQMPEPARQVSPSGREDSVQKRQRPAEVTTVLTTTGVCSGNEIATLTDDQNAMHTANLKELLDMDKIWCGGGGRQTAIATSSLDTLGIETKTGRILQSATCGTRFCSNGQFG